MPQFYAINYIFGLANAKNKAERIFPTRSKNVAISPENSAMKNLRNPGIKKADKGPLVTFLYFALYRALSMSISSVDRSLSRSSIISRRSLSLPTPLI